MGLNLKNVGFVVLLNSGAEWVTALLDWKKRKSITINGSAKTSDLDDPFSSDGWTDSGADVGIAGGVMAFDINRTAIDQSSYLDLGSALDDEHFVIRLHDIQITTKSGGIEVFIGVSSNTSGGATAQDFIGLAMGDTTADRLLYGVDSDGGVITRITGDYAYSLSTSYYAEIIRLSSTKYRIIIYSDSEFTEVLFSKDYACASTTASLRYLKVCNAQVAGSTENIVGSFTRVEVYDGVTVVQNIPSQQTALAVWGTSADQLIEDFSTYVDEADSDASWISTDESILDVNLATDVLYMNNTGANTDNDVIYYDLGAGIISENSWTFRTKIDITTLTSRGDTNTQFSFIGLTDTTASPLTNQNFAGIRLLTHSDVGNKFGIISGDNTSLNIPTNSTHVLTMSTGIKYLELKQINGTVLVFTIYADSNYSEVIVTGSLAIASHTQAFRYFKCCSVKTITSGNGTITNTIDDIQFWNNITEVNPTTLTDYPVPVNIIGDAELQRKTAETSDFKYTTAESWTKTGTAATVDDNITGKCSLKDIPNNADHRVTKALGSTLSNSKWIAHTEFKATVSNAGSNIVWWLSSSSGTLRTTHDVIGLEYVHGSGLHFWINDGGSTSSDATYLSVTVGKQYYLTIMRLSTTLVRLELYSDKARTILIGSRSYTILSTAGNSLTHVQHGGETTGGTADVGDFELDNFKVWDGITNPAEQETATHTENFSADAWVDQDTKQQVTGGSLVYDPRRDNTNDASSYDLQTILGSGVFADDNAWCLQYVQNHSSVYTSGNGNRLWMGISDKNSATAQNGTHDFIGLYQNFDVNSKHGAVGANGATLPQNNTGTVSPATSTNYYTRISRINKTKMRVQVWTGGYDEIVFYDEFLTISSAITQLRYLWIGNLVDGAGGASITGTIDDLSFWNGISSPNATARKFVFTNNDFTDNAIEYSSETVSYDPINGDYFGYVKVPSLATGANTIIQMYYDYLPSDNPSYVPEDLAIDVDEQFTTSTGWTQSGSSVNVDSAHTDRVGATSTIAGDYVYKTGGITELDNERFIMDFEFNHPSTNANNLYIELASTNSPSYSGSYYGLAFNMQDNGVDYYGIISNNNNGTRTETVFSNLTKNTTYYGRMKRTSATTVECSIYSDSARTTLVETKQQTINADIKGLDNLAIWANGSGGNYWYDNVQIKSGYNSFPTREQSVWDANYKLVAHLNGNSLDSTVNGNNGTDTAMDSETLNGKLGRITTSTSSVIDFGSNSSLDELFNSGATLEFVLNNKSASYGFVVEKWAAGLGWIYRILDTTNSFNDSFITDVSTDGEWRTADGFNQLSTTYHTVVKYHKSADSIKPQFVKDGITIKDGAGLVTIQQNVGAMVDSAQNLRIGLSGSTPTKLFICELRYSSIIRPQCYNETNYNAEKENSDFITVGAETIQ